MGCAAAGHASERPIGGTNARLSRPRLETRGAAVELAHPQAAQRLLLPGFLNRAGWPRRR